MYLFFWAFQVALVINNLPANAGDSRDLGSIPRLGRSPGKGNDNPLQYSCLENPMYRGTWQAMIHRVTKSHMRLKWLSTHIFLLNDPIKRVLTFYPFWSLSSFLNRYFFLFPLCCVTWHAGSYLTRDQTRAPSSGSEILTMGPPGKSQSPSSLLLH